MTEALAAISAAGILLPHVLRRHRIPRFTAVALWLSSLALRRPIVWEDPERGDLSNARAEALARPVRAAERALYGRGSWRRWIDEASAVDFALLNELFKNEDGFHASTYMALADGRLRLGPIWDFDISMGNSDYGPSRRLRGWMLAERDWTERLYRDRGFRRALAARWRELRAAGLRRNLLATVEKSRRRLRGAAGRNFRRWPVLHRRIWPNPVARGSFRAEVRHLRTWLVRRVEWLDARLCASSVERGRCSSRDP
jgi:CotH kinase protein